ncbi:MAG: hypothetical protein Q8K72_14805 [Acidimicrobiales bacterium]|nr:hypothetical protein [Acidimicrobiales bacterium]
MSTKLAALLTAILLAATACATEADRAQVHTGAASLAAVRGAPDAAAAVTTARFELTVAMAVEGRSLEMTSSGAFDRPGGRLAIDLDLSGLLGQAGLAGADQPMQVVIDGSTAYLRLPMLEPLTGTSGWLAADVASLDELERSALFGAAAADPSSALEVLRGSSDDLEVVGPESIRGLPTTHYRTTVDLADALDAAPEVARMLDGPATELPVDLGAVPVDVWLDDAGLVHRLVIAIEPTHGAAPPVTATLTLELFDHGRPVDIEVPQAHEVTPADEVLGSLGQAFLGAGE